MRWQGSTFSGLSNRPRFFFACLSVAALIGCRNEAYYSEAQTPPQSDPAQLHSAINKLDVVYETNYGSKFTAKISPLEVAIGSALYQGDAQTAVSQINKNRKLFSDATAAAKACLFELSKNTTIVNPTDHDNYANFYNAEGDRLNSKAAEYSAFLDLKAGTSKANITALMVLVSNARVAEYVAKTLKSA